jgi:predicted permease
MFMFFGKSVRRLRGLMSRGEHERRMDDEVRFHLEMEAAELRGAGVSASEAMRQARLRFGGVERFKEEGRDARGTRPIEELWQDLNYGARQLRRTPGFTAATVLTLALGIGATTMLQSDRRYLASEVRTLASPEGLVYVGQGPERCLRCRRMAAGNYASIRSRARSFEHMSMIAEWEPILRGTERAELTDGQRVTTEFFQTLRIQAMLGRTLLPDDGAGDRQHVVVLTEAMWRDRFGSDKGVLGRTIILDRLPYTIVGVVANDAVYPSDTEFWAPLVLTAGQLSDRQNTEYGVVARLRDGTTAQLASVELATIASQLTSESQDVLDGSTFVVVPVLSFHRMIRGLPQTFTVAVALVLLIACVNLAVLLIARLSVRGRELAVRRALGAATGRIIRQLLTETILVTVLGGLLGAAVAVWGGRILLGWPEILFDVGAFAFALASGLVSGLVIGLWPSIRSARPKLMSGLRDGTRTATGGIDTAGARRSLVVGEVAVAIVLLAAAALLARSFQKIYAIRPGFDTDRVLALRVQSPPPSPGTHADAEQFDRLVRAIEAIPGVERAGATLGLPFGHGSIAGSFEVEGRATVTSGQRPRASMQSATPGYFEALGIPIVRGRSFSEGDRANAPRVALINQVVAQRFFPDEDPIGRAVIIDDARWEIVGVVGAVFHGNVEQMTPTEIYRPAQQWERPSVWIAMRTRTDPATIGPNVAEAVRRFDPDIAITRLLTMSALRANDMASERRMLRVMAAFALAAVLISVIGLYGVISYSVSQRTREFGVRLALGAKRSAVLGLVLGQGVRLAAMGAAFGIAVALGVLRLMRAMLFGVSPVDPLTLGAVALTMCAVAVFAAYLPAHRAMRIDPMTSLRDD